MRQDKGTPFETLSLRDVQTVSVGDTHRTGFYYGLPGMILSGYVSGTLLPNRLVQLSSRLGLILPASKTHETKPLLVS